MTLELGGKSAAVVLDDADLDAAVEALRLGSFRNNGQICTPKTRVLVSPRRHDELVDRLVGPGPSMPPGDPQRPGDAVGPLVTAASAVSSRATSRAPATEGAKAAVGGGRPEGLDRGWYVEPTVFTGVDTRHAHRPGGDLRAGPVRHCIRRRGRGHRHRQRLRLRPQWQRCSAPTSSTACEIAERINTGTVELNGSPAGSERADGWGESQRHRPRERPEGLAPYTEPKAIGLPAALAQALTESHATTAA